MPVMPVRKAWVRQADPTEGTPSPSALASSPMRPCGRHASCKAHSRQSDDDGQQVSPCRLPPQPPPATRLSLAPSTVGGVQPAHRSPYLPRKPPSGLTERTASEGKLRRSGPGSLHADDRALTISYRSNRHLSVSV